MCYSKETKARDRVKLHMTILSDSLTFRRSKIKQAFVLGAWWVSDVHHLYAFLLEPQQRIDVKKTQTNKTPGLYYANVKKNC